MHEDGGGPKESQGHLYMRKVACMHIRVPISTNESRLRIGEENVIVYLRTCVGRLHFSDNSTIRPLARHPPRSSVFSLQPVSSPIPLSLQALIRHEGTALMSTHTTSADPFHSLERPSNLSKSQDGENIISITKSVSAVVSLSSISTNHNANRPLRPSKR